jgi:hypothetical protein
MIFLVALFSRSIVKVLHNVQAFQMLLMLETNLARVFFYCECEQNPSPLYNSPFIQEQYMVHLCIFGVTRSCNYIK